jgi:5-methylcytosine-specific restriction endonuclease McrA
MHEKLLKLVRLEKKVTAKILNCLQIVSEQKLYFSKGYSSLFDYMVRGLGYSETTASFRLSCLRMIEIVPEIKDKIESGALTYTSLARAHKVLRGKTTAEKRKVISEIEGKSSRDALFILSKYEEERPILVKTEITNQKVRITIDLNREEYEKLERVRALHSNKVQSYEDLLKYLIHKELRLPTDYSQSKSKNPKYIPKHLKNFVLQRASYKCEKPNCNQKHYLEVDHIQPIAKGGRTVADNLQILCRAHNQQKSDHI